MTNFKGTKGKWQFVRYEKTFTIETFGITNWTILQTITNEPQDESNAKLIAFAPEMLQMLDELIYAFDKENLNGYQEERIEEAQQLIKKATDE